MRYLLAILICLPLVVRAQGFFDQSGASVGVADWRTSLVAYWPLDSLNQGKAADLSGNGRMATNNNVSIASGIIGNAGLFVPASSAYLNPPSIQASSAGFTFMCWFKTIATVDGTYGMVCQSKPAAEQGRWFLIRDTGQSLAAAFSDSSGNTSATNIASVGISPFTNGIWTHACGVLSAGGGIINLYTNGVLAASKTFSQGAYTNSDKCFIGVYQSSTGQAPLAGTYFNGSIDDVRIYNRALTSNEISAIYRWGWGSHANTPTHP